MNTLNDNALATAIQIDGWSVDPWSWIRDCCWSVDEADKAVKRFPDKEYLKQICNVWTRESILAIPKSRRMLLTWVMLALHLHHALFNQHAGVFIQSDKQTKSDYLLGQHRLLFIYNHLPTGYPWPQIERRAAGEEGGTRLIEFDNGSRIAAIPQGADALRQYTASAVMCDEIAFWAWAESTWTALRPIIQGGGKITLVSSAGPGFFQKIVEGEIE